MKKLLIGFILSAAVSAPVFADESPSASEVPGFCEWVGDLARDVMTLRQSGTPMHKMMEVFGDNEFIKIVVTNSFKVHQYGTKPARDMVINEYGNAFHMNCLEVYGEK